MSVVRMATALLAAGACLTPASAAAQGAAAGGKWEVEFHTAGVYVSSATGGTGIAEFPVGPPIATGGLSSTSRAVSSWYFGDGAALLNQVNAVFFVTARVVPLDAALRGHMAHRQKAAALGFRVSRELRPRLAAEFNFDYAPTGLRFTPDAVAAIEASRASFVPAWTGLLITGATTDRQVASMVDPEFGDGHQLTTTGALRLYFSDAGRFRPFATAGGGVIFERGTQPAVTLTGSYSFRFAGLAPIDERDVVTVRVDPKDSTFVGMFGGGFDYLFTPHQGIRVGLRLHLMPNNVDTVISATPSVTLQSPPFAVSTGTNPGIQFSNTTLLGRQSSLSGPNVTDLRTFTGSGIYLQTHFAVGYFVRF